MMLSEGQARALAFSPSGKRIAACGEKAAHVWETRSGKEIGAGITHAGAILSLDFSFDDRYLLTGSEDQTAKLSDLAAGVPVMAPMKCGGVVRKVSVSPDGSRIATMLDDGSVLFWNALDGRQLEFDLREDAPFNDFLWSRSGLRVTTISQGGHATMWTMRRGTRFGELISQEGPVICAAISQNSKFLATGCMDGRACVWRTDGGMPLPTVRAHAARARTAFYSLDGNDLVTASEDRTALHWISGQVHPFGPALKLQGKVNCAVFDANAAHILTGDDSGIAQVWSAATGRRAGPPYVLKGPVRWIDFHPDGERCVTVSIEPELRSGAWAITTSLSRSSNRRVESRPR